MKIKVTANGMTILEDDLWYILFTFILRHGVCTLNPEAELKVFADDLEIEKPYSWDYDESKDVE